MEKVYVACVTATKWHGDDISIVTCLGVSESSYDEAYGRAARTLFEKYPDYALGKSSVLEYPDLVDS